MSEFKRVEELNIMKVIAETLNRCNDMTMMLQSVLEELLELTKLETGWVFLVNQPGDYVLAAHHGLPPALSWGKYQPMCSGDCYCLSRYRNGKLDRPVNIIECKRLNDAIQNSWGDTNGITHHATIPLGDGEDSFGVLNVASPSKENFSEEELTLLQSLGYQIGTAIRRTRLYQEEQKRAENYEKLNELVGILGAANDLEELRDLFCAKGGDIFQWSSIGFHIKEWTGDPPPFAFAHQTEAEVREEGSLAVVPITRQQEVLGVVWISPAKGEVFRVREQEIFQALARHLSLVYESIILQEKRQELLLHEERKRLARDLHDSVNQKLFSLSLTAKGAKGMVTKYDPSLGELMDEMWLMSQKSLKEMRSLIWQLRPVGLEEGVLSAMKKYGEHLGLALQFDVERLPDWSRTMEETFWRIGQEAMNNIAKHAGTNVAAIQFYETEKGVGMIVTDAGAGVEEPNGRSRQTLGLTSMKERAELLGGTFSFQSERGKGTKVSIFLPYRNE
ncbi:GAF domain-containing sensor histidine kinase [Halobacillus karajensis]|uniref:Oxygen sensor histidine kinase NreB n=1 Tax=Halobacillus karajensis TaxID=195088 RepID=A0A024P9D5_9BACI|nr:GAF domain-containing sensor histidine kinase [Halobacillus karajensis]CDQ20302.1 Sensor histidine kinase LiaS [Halobacillus karajensis]CDQ25037.1 Sensor histidine kinase LiaS [Halobacillus karajensis]CDQ28602.1 Sensor histidine kinase LiaS [Halobacillus karajensis]